MKTLYTHSETNTRKTYFLITGFLILVILVGYVFSLVFETRIILYLAVAFSIVSAFVSYWWSHKIVLGLAKAHKLEFKDNKELYRVVENLCITAGLKMPTVYIMEEDSPNAFATGRNQDKAVIVVTRGLLNTLDRNELEGVIAHELSHIGNRDILLATITTVLVGFIVILTDWFRHWAFFGGLRNSGENKGKMQLILIIVALVLSILAPIFAYIMKFSISRKREYLADSDGALLTRYPEGLASALEKIDKYPKGIKNANRATAHLYISSPIKKKKRLGMFKKAFMTHPLTEERIKKLRKLNI